MNVTGVFILTTLVVSLSLNVWWFFDDVMANTISAHVRISSGYTVLPPTSMGVLVGHWFGMAKWHVPHGFWVLVTLGVSIAAVEVVTKGALARHTNPMQWALLGVALSVSLWPMTDTPP